MRKFARVFALVLVGVTSAIGLTNIPDELRHPGGTLLQQSVQLGGVLHSVLGVLLAIGMLRRQQWAIPLAIVWTVVVVYTAGVATIAWEEEMTSGVLVGTAAAIVSCALLGWLVVWAARDSRTRHIPATSDSPTTR